MVSEEVMQEGELVDGVALLDMFVEEKRELVDEDDEECR